MTTNTKTATTTEAKFVLGQTVTMAAYTDCFEVHHPAVSGRIVDMRLVPASSIPAYYRLRMQAVNGNQHEAAERFFTS